MSHARRGISSKTIIAAMNAATIEAILFDMGGTLRSSTPQDPARGRACIAELVKTLGASMPVADMQALLAQRAKAYSRWSRQMLVELNEQDLWTQWMLPDYPPEQIAPLAITLNQLWRESIGVRQVFPETKEILPALFRRGYRLGLVSNTTSSIESPALLRELELAGLMEVVLLSCVTGTRKPGPEILLEAARRMGIAPGRCAYVGDRIDRDVAAARQAGFGLAVILGEHGVVADGASVGDPLGLADDAEHDSALALQPGFRIHNLMELLDIFAPRPAPQPAEVYDAALSTMWAINNLPTLPDFMEQARRLGFARVELNHRVDSAMLAGMDLNRDGRFGSVHEPCPADIREEELKRRDWLISSLDEANRAEGVRAIARSLALAHQVGAQAIVIHAGQSAPDRDRLEKRLRALVEAGRTGGAEAQNLRTQMIELRARHAPQTFPQVRKSIAELLEIARPLGVALAIENRYHYLEHPSPDELVELLALGAPEQIGMLYDVGHAETLDRLGFYPRTEWLERFGARIIGTHLHDVVGTSDHYAPGLGDADYRDLARILPQSAFRTCEFQTFNNFEQVSAGLRHLEQQGIVHKVRMKALNSATSGSGH